MHKPLAFLDTETTGLDPVEHEIIEIGIIRRDIDGNCFRFHSLIKPEHIETAHPKALAVNGYAKNPSLWDSAPSLKEKAPEIAQILEGCILVGHNVSFDEGMLKGNFKNIGIDLRIPHRKIDTITLVFEHLFPLGLRDASLDGVRKFLNWSKEDAHTAMKDSEDVMHLYDLLNGAGLFIQLWIRLKRLLGIEV